VSGYVLAPDLAERLECAQLAAAFESQGRPKALASPRTATASPDSTTASAPPHLSRTDEHATLVWHRAL